MFVSFRKCLGPDTARINMLTNRRGGLSLTKPKVGTYLSQNFVQRSVTSSY